MNLPDGNVIAPTGKAFDLDIATSARRDGDLLIEEFVFWDSALQAKQIGLAWRTLHPAATAGRLPRCRGSLIHLSSAGPCCLALMRHRDFTQPVQP